MVTTKTGLQFTARHRYDAGFQLDVEFSAPAGVTAIFGPSGGGKTTILHIIAGVLKPQRGVVRWNDLALLDTDARVCVPPEERNIGIVSQDNLLFPHLSVERNLCYGRRRRTTQAIDFDKVVQVLGLSPLLKRLPHMLSGGQRQRTALGRAILSNPSLLLMDEPLAALDEKLKDRILSYLERVVAEWHIPTLFVSHNQSDVRRLAQNVVVIENGSVVDTGPTGSTLDRAAIVGLRSHPGPINLLRLTSVRRVGDHYEGRIGEQNFHLPDAPERDEDGTWITIRPSGVAISRGDVAGLSIRNHLRGKVEQIAPCGEHVFVAVDVGQRLWAELTPEAVRELELSPGVGVVCLIKSVAAHLLPPAADNGISPE